MTVMTGGCQCGEVRFRAVSLKDNPHVCHCRMCQKAVGGFFAALVGVLNEDLIWTRGQAAVFNSSAGIERGFCRDCGTPLFYHRVDGAHYSLSIGAFDNPAAIPLRFEYGAEGKLPQIAQLTMLSESYVTEIDDPADAEAIRASNRQHPDHDTAVWPAWG